MDDFSTIAAIATPAGSGGISIIRVSGPNAVPIAAALFQPCAGRPVSRPAGLSLESHRLYYGHIVDSANGRTLDEVLLSVMKAPRSYTREDVLEINAHGGPVAVRLILEAVLRQGARLAEPGEFTRRAFLNGRIDLTQAEAVADMISARSDRSLSSAAALLEGGLRQEVQKIRTFCLDLLVRLEAGIDFPEEVGELIDARATAAELHERAVLPLKRLIRNHVQGRVIFEGLKVSIVGRPNVGKSSLMNRLLGRERVIVTPYPGTTRDVIEDTLIVQGIPVMLRDTAGLHSSRDPIETLGMARTLENSGSADLVLFVLEAHRPLNEEDLQVYEWIRARPMLIVLNKIDLLNGSAGKAEIPDDWPRERCVPISALSGQGVEELPERIIKAATGESGKEISGIVIPNLRQKELLERSLASAVAAATDLVNGSAPELIAIHLTRAMAGLGEILGTTVKVEILDAIFSRFCIGK
ncbi:MAG: tRNA uridine-5-carboxymethylaminomethyl(34) synthesis GTPase MnmE [Syntrophobacterales bacterium]|nr:MAG: tRNA uridine-5-carboxymethylaminomethyl(34) synthesis GTPase MnmE [Syntrophobacterales bacterium]